MVKEFIMFTAKLDGLTALEPRGGPDDQNLPYYFKLKCFNCGYVTDKDSCIVLSVTVDDGKGFPNLVQQCKGCTRVGTVTLVPGYGSPLTLDKSTAGEYAPLMLLDYQGLEPVDFSFGKGWKAASVLGTQFEIDLAEGEFSAYCVKGKVPVSLSGFEVKLG